MRLQKIFIAFLVSGFLISCGGSSSKETVSESPDQPTPAATEAQPNGETVSGELSITDVRKEDGGKYSATLNNAIVFRELELKDDDEGKEKLFFPKTPGKNEKMYPIVYLDDRTIANKIKEAIKAGKASGKGAPGTLKVTEVRWKELDGSRKVKGFADVTLNSAVTIKGCKLIEGKDGLFVGWPSVKRGEDYVDLIFSSDKDVRDMIESAIKKESGLK